METAPAEISSLRSLPPRLVSGRVDSPFRLVSRFSATPISPRRRQIDRHHSRGTTFFGRTGTPERRHFALHHRHLRRTRRKSRSLLRPRRTTNARRRQEELAPRAAFRHPLELAPHLPPPWRIPRRLSRRTHRPDGRPLCSPQVQPTRLTAAPGSLRRKRKAPNGLAVAALLIFLL